MEYFQRLGAELDGAWRAVGRDEERFPEVAARVLADRPPLEHFEREAFLDDWLDPRRPASLQLAPLGAFGQPGMTVHHGDGFVVEIYYWLNSESAIHNHPFCGVFTVLEGWSVHARYRVTEGERVGRIRLMDVGLDRLQLVRPGTVEPFSPRAHPLVHALIHVPVPSISMVVRTVRTAGYLRYLPPTLALPMDSPPEPAARRTALLEALGAAGDPRHGERLARELRQADFETCIRLLASGWSTWDPAQRAELLALVPAQHGAHVDKLPPALDRSVRVAEASAIRERLLDPSLRLVATALGYADSRAQVLELLTEYGDPQELLSRFVAEADLFSPGEEASALIARALAAGEDRTGVLRCLAAEYGADALRPHADEIARHCQSSIFSVLLPSQG